jgi:signal peptidase I
MTFRLSNIFKGLVIAAILVGVWFFLAPTQLGGSNSMLIIKGVSMKPSISQGDLVVVRRQPDYSIGEVAAYHDTLSKQRVLHRIIAHEGDRYVFKGDNNTAKDAFKPTKDQILGKEWLRIPKAGNVLTWVQSPTNAAILAIGAMILAAGGGAAVEQRRRRRVKGGPAATPPRQPRQWSPLLLVPAAVLVLAGILALISFGASRQRAVSVPKLYQQVGGFSYLGRAQRGPVYPSGKVTTGQTAFTQLVSALNVSFDYRFLTDRSAVIHGQTSMTARLSSDDTGWSRTFVVAPARKFTGKAATAHGVLNLRQLAQIADHVQSDTGSQATNFHVALLPVVTVQGLVGSEQILQRVSPELDFVFDGRRLEIDKTGSNAATRVSSYGAGTEYKTNTVNLRLAKMSVPTARTVSLIGLALGLIGLLGFSALTVKRRMADEPQQIQRTYGHLLLPILELPALEKTVEVDSIDALATLADRYDRAILHHVERGIHTYLLQDEGLAYRYVSLEPELLESVVAQPSEVPETEVAWPPPGWPAQPSPQSQPGAAPPPPPEAPGPYAPGGSV